AAELGMHLVRAATPSSDSRFAAMVAELVQERLSDVEPSRRDRIGALPAEPNRCVGGCCANPRGIVAALAGEGDMHRG
ncbi:MAG TPA: ferrochelatase, partial [Actinomycetes bacterium]|nr:ferrochelatase [Actinomycetes bacterium]